nr:diguanylate cyclase [uncultured Halomonas sp.]
MAEKILATLCTPYWVSNQRIDLSASLGIAIYPGDGKDTTTLINHADAAMYRAKRLGGGRAEIHDQILDSGL